MLLPNTNSKSDTSTPVRNSNGPFVNTSSTFPLEKASAPGIAQFSISYSITLSPGRTKVKGLPNRDSRFEKQGKPVLETVRLIVGNRTQARVDDRHGT